jgi:hypothetical protein
MMLLELLASLDVVHLAPEYKGTVGALILLI